MTTQEIVAKLQGNPSPSELSKFKVHLAANYASLAWRLKEILAEKAIHWEGLRQQCTSDTQAERAWQRMPAGREETILRLDMKVIEKQMSAITTRISVAQGEARNEY